MSFRLEPTERLTEGLRRIMREQLERALQDMACSDDDLHAGIHDARKCFKKIRAILRLIREPLGDARYRRENRRYRDAGRRIAHVRDSKVHLETLDELCNDSLGRHLDIAICRQIREQLTERHEAVLAETLDKGTVRRRVALVLDEGLRDLEQWPEIHDDFAALVPGLLKIYGAGRKAFRGCQRKPETVALHEWRKQVKYLWYQLRILCPIWPEHMEAYSESFHSLSSALGLDHDLALLQEEIKDFDIPDDGHQIISQLVGARRLQTQHEAILLGMRLYAERPAAFVDRLHAYWHAMRATHSGIAVHS